MYGSVSRVICPIEATPESAMVNVPFRGVAMARYADPAQAESNVYAAADAMVLIMRPVRQIGRAHV